MRKEIHSDKDRRWPANEIPQSVKGGTKEENEEAFAKDYTRKCEVCEGTPVVNATGLCGPCTFGEAKTIDGNW